MDKEKDRKDDPREGEEVSAGDGIMVKFSVQSNAKKVDPAGGGGGGNALSKDEGTINELGKGSESTSPPDGRKQEECRREVRASDSEVKPFETSEEVEAHPHPCLFIDNVIDVVFKHILNQPGPRTATTTDVRNIRLVCKTWRTSVTRLYRQTRPETSFAHYDRDGHARGWNTFNHFMTTMTSSPMVPVQKYKFGEGVFVRRDLRMFKEFLLLCGPEMVVLSLDIGLGEAERLMLKLRNLPGLELKQLKRLKLRTFEYDRGADKYEHKFGDYGLVKFCELLLTAAKSLEEVRMEYHHTHAYSGSHQGPVVQQLCLVIAKRVARTVKKLELKMEVNEAGFNNLAGMGAKLESLSLQVPPRMGSRTMYRFLQSQAATLQDLEFWESDDYNKLVIEFPRLDELVDLQLPHSTVSVNPASHFAETFPKLDSLETNTENALSTLLSTVTKPSGSLKFLDMASWRSSCPPPLIRKVAQSFPCLAELYIDQHGDNREMMEEVFKYLGSLEILHIHFWDFNRNANWVDSLFSGISERDCKRIRRGQDFGSVNLNEFQRLPSIVNLRSLKELNIEEHGDGDDDVAFTDVTAHFVFLEMDHLREISLPESAVQFSPRYLGLLRDKLVLCEED